MERTATLSADGLYRYELTRRWGPGRALGWIMLNPSTADALVDDRTIGRCVGFARSLGYDAITVANLYALRATDPLDLWKSADPVGPGNDDALTAILTQSAGSGGLVIAAWGANARPARVAQVLALPDAGTLSALALTKAGQPRHPLYLPGTCVPAPWHPDAPVPQGGGVLPAH